jgi:hypothetical protein
MKVIKIKPQLVDHSLLRTKPPARPLANTKVKTPLKEPSVPESSSLSSLFNLFGLLVLVIGGLYLYQRYTDRDQDEFERQHTILGFSQYVENALRTETPETASSPGNNI